MKNLILILSGLIAMIFVSFAYLQMEKKKEVEPEEAKRSEDTKNSSKMEAPASQPEVLPKSNSKQERSLVDEGATGNND